MTLTIGIGGGIAYANAGQDNKIYACASKSTGVLRLANTRCRSTENPVVWNVKGPKGDTGADGTDGTDGTDGLDGVSGYEIVSESFSNTYTGPGGDRAGYTVSATCPDGKRAVGGGAEAGLDNGTSTGGRADLESTRPASDGSAWISNVVKTGGLLVTGERIYGTAYAVCVDIAPDPV